MTVRGDRDVDDGRRDAGSYGFDRVVERDKRRDAASRRAELGAECRGRAGRVNLVVTEEERAAEEERLRPTPTGKGKSLGSCY